MLNANDYLRIEEHIIAAIGECSITIDRSDYREEDISEFADKITIPPIFDIYIKDKEDFVSIVLPYSEINIQKTQDIEDDEKVIVINYEKDDIIIEQVNVDKTIDLKMVDRILNGRMKVLKKPETILQLIHDAIPSADLCHIEVIISQMYRDSKGGLSRLSGKYDEIWGVQKISKNESWLSAMSYQDVNRGIKMGLVSGKGAKMNPIEKVISGKFRDL